MCELPPMEPISDLALLRQEMNLLLTSMETRQALIFAELRQDLRNVYVEITALREHRAGMLARHMILQWIIALGLSIASLFAGSKLFGHG